MPIHFHTHDSCGGQIASLLLAAEEGVDIVDCAFAPLAGLTSQPSLNTLVEALRFTPRATGLAYDDLQTTADYWEDVRTYYASFESGQSARECRGLPARDAGRPVHEPRAAGASAGVGRPLARSRPHVRRRQSDVRRHRQGDADVESRRRHGAVHARQQPDARRCGRTARASWRFPSRWSNSSRAGSVSRRAASPRSCKSASCAAASR